MPDNSGSYQIKPGMLAIWGLLFIAIVLVILGKPIFDNRDKGNALELQQKAFDKRLEDNEKDKIFFQTLITKQNTEVLQKQDEILKKETDILIEQKRVATAFEAYLRWLKVDAK